MTESVQNPFSAADSAIGYLYQARVALLWALRKLPAEADLAVSLETLDDVTFETLDGSPPQLLQTKHHRKRTATLTDASPDLWKSLRIWLVGRGAGQVPEETLHYLLTTAEAPKGSIAYWLRETSRDVDAALIGLERTAQTSRNTENAAAYQLFLNTAKTLRRNCVQDLFVIDSSESIAALDQEFRSLLFSAVGRRHMEPFLSRLEGWWLHRVLRQLMKSGDRIFAEEIEAQMSDLREQFQHESLPIDDDLLNISLDETAKASHADSVFVRQIELTKASKERIFAAIRNYYRAFEQRSRWLREDLLLIGELNKYEGRLVEEWELVFAAMKDKCGTAATEDMKERFARDILVWAEQEAPARVYIRPRVTEPFVTRGSLHMLADNLRVGWHLEFQERLSILLQAKGQVA